MNKLMIATAAALCATVGFSDITSSNCVGYNTKTSRAGLNWYAPSFLSVGQTTTDINAIKLDDGKIGTDDQMVGYGDNMQIVGPGGNATAIYCYWDPMFHPSGTATEFYWGDGEGNPVEISFDAGDGVGIDNTTEDVMYSIINAGQVPTEDVSFTSRAGLNWTGNPFPAPIDINAVTLDDGKIGTDDQMVGYGDNMQIVGPGGNATAIYCYWDPMFHPSGEATKFYWGDGEGNPVEYTINPGDGFAIDNTTDGVLYTIKIACPYSL